MIMTRKEKLYEIIQRLNKPENNEKRTSADNEQGIGIKWHLKRAQSLLENMNNDNITETQKSLYENTFSNSIREIERLLNEQNWK